MLAFSPLPLLRSLLSSRSSLATPLGSSSSINLFPSLPSNESLTVSRPYNPTAPRNSSLSSGGIPPGKTKAGWDWIINATEGLLACQKEDAPDAWISQIRTQTFSESTTNNVADLREPDIWCYDTQSGDKLYTSATVGSDGKAEWRKPVRSRNPHQEPEMPWPPEHDIAEAAAVVTEPFTRIEYYQHGGRASYGVCDGGMPFALEDAATLTFGPYSTTGIAS